MQEREHEPGDLPPVEQASELASPWARLAAVIIDWLLLYLVPGLIFLVSGLSEDDTSSGLIAVAILIFVVVFVVQMVLLGTRGQTIGKIALRVRVVDARTGAHPGWPRLVLLRTIVNWILQIIPFYGLVDALFIFRADHRTIHDLYSGTRVDKLMS